MNERLIINYIIQRLTDGENLDKLIAELRITSNLLERLPSYETDKIVEAIFGSVEVTEDA